jgi:hypothetical protein
MAVDGEYSHNPAHAAEAVGHLINFFRKPRNSAFVSALCEPIQNIEDVLWATYNAFDLDTAVGDQLDKLGLLVGELRNDRDDTAYRVAIRVRILVNSSMGTLPELIDILTQADPTLDHEATEYYPATVVFWWLGAFPELTSLELFQLIKQAKPAAVRLMAVVYDADSFIWDTVAVAGGADALSWSTVASYPAGGGEWAQVHV